MNNIRFMLRNGIISSYSFVILYFLCMSLTKFYIYVVEKFIIIASTLHISHLTTRCLNPTEKNSEWLYLAGYQLSIFKESHSTTSMVCIILPNWKLITLWIKYNYSLCLSQCSYYSNEIHSITHKCLFTPFCVVMST